MTSDIIQSIEVILKWYTKQGPTATVPQILTERDKLELFGYRMAEWAAELKTSYNGAYFMRRIGVARIASTMIKEGTKIGAATNAALLANEKEYQEEQEAEGEAYKIDLLLKQMNRIGNAMSQRIRYLMDENNRTQRQDAT